MVMGMASGMTINRRQFIAMTLVAGASTLPLASCKRSQLEGAEARYNPDYAVAVIQTNRQTPSTFIDYYDENLDLVASLEYPYMMVQSPWGKPEFYGGYVYMTPQGATSGSSAAPVVALELATGEVKELDADGGASNVTANERYVFAAAFGGMGRIDKETGEVLSIEQSGYLFPFAYENNVYVFNSMRPDDYAHAWLYVMDESLNILDTIDFGPDSYVTQPTGFIGDRLYFASIFGDDEIPWEDKVWNLSYYSLKDAEVHTLMSVRGMRLEFVESIRERLYVMATGDIAGDSLNKILVVNEKTGDIESECRLGSFVPQYLLTRDGVLYIGGTEMEERTHALRSYVPDGTGLKETGMVVLDRYSSSSNSYYVGGLFARN
jgi:hypothetical protein